MPFSIVGRKKHHQAPDRKLSPRSRQAKRASQRLTTVYLTIYVFRGEPDVLTRRHVLMYFTSPDNPEFHETIHIQRDDENSPWFIERERLERDWIITNTYLSHVNAGTVQAYCGRESAIVDVFETVPVEDRDDGFNCQHFLLEGMQEMVRRGYQTWAWYTSVEDELTTELVRDTAG
ncbi:hypothetical protein SAMD00023353_7200450 [Rosellinia necatrix]|uniref:Uncharacterized protein n=1 Tax=Rosellinia necatrix TaxID=77044 RepID=A0A1S8AAI9_ROSNE|nr:hypothetical protein SAMD00023353_7200450 [Rosellinia necatrix]